MAETMENTSRGHSLPHSHHCRRVGRPQFPEVSKRVYPIFHGADHLKENNGESPLAVPYFLYVGTLEKRKNLGNILKAFKDLLQKPKRSKTRHYWGPGYGAEDIQKQIANFPFPERIFQPGFVRNEDLVSYYRHAIALVYPSLYEGFGIPIVAGYEIRLSCLDHKVVRVLLMKLQVRLP